jgi:hypothetical protein
MRIILAIALSMSTIALLGLILTGHGYVALVGAGFPPQIGYLALAGAVFTAAVGVAARPLA